MQYDESLAKQHAICDFGLIRLVGEILHHLKWAGNVTTSFNFKEGLNTYPGPFFLKKTHHLQESSDLFRAVQDFVHQPFLSEPRSRLYG